MATCPSTRSALSMPTGTATAAALLAGSALTAVATRRAAG